MQAVHKANRLLSGVHLHLCQYDKQNEKPTDSSDELLGIHECQRLVLPVPVRRINVPEAKVAEVHRAILKDIRLLEQHDVVVAT